MPDVAGDLLDLILPRRCVVCGRDGAALCRACVPAAGTHVVAAGATAGRLEVVAAGLYADALRRALIVYKERGRRDLAGVLGALLGRSVGAVLDRAARTTGDVVLVPIPSSRAAAATRGGDHLARLTRRAARASGIRVTRSVLQPTRAVLDSAGLGVGARAANLHEAFRAGPSIGRTALLVDDIVTTGATLCEAHRALTTAGWPVCGAAVVAATPRRAATDPLAVPT